FAVFSSAVLLMASCSKDDTSAPKDSNSTDISKTELSDSLEEVMVKNLDVGFVNFDSTGRPTTDPAHSYVLFNLSEGKVVSNEDSTSGNWDIGFYCPNVFSGTDIILNNTIHGPGSVEGQIVNEEYNNIE